MANIVGTTLTIAWQQLEASLRRANKLFLDRADGGRAAALDQLSATNRFISTVSGNDRLLQMPLFALNVAVYYLELVVVVWPHACLQELTSPVGPATRTRGTENSVRGGDVPTL